MNFILQAIGVPFQYILGFFSSITGSYTIAIIIFTVLVNLAMSPLNVKQQKNMAKQARLRPKLEMLKEKYGDDRMKMSTAQQELYQQENISPTGGCMPMLIRMLILMGVYGAVSALVGTGVYQPVDYIKHMTVNLDLFGLDLSKTPSFSEFSLLWLIPILSGVASLLSMLINQAQQKKTNPAMQNAGGSMMGMMLIMPIFSIWIAFSVQAAVGFYWIVSNVVNTVIQMVVNHYYSANKMLAVQTLEEAEKRRKYEEERIARITK